MHLDVKLSHQAFFIFLLLLPFSSPSSFKTCVHPSRTQFYFFQIKPTWTDILMCWHVRTSTIGKGQPVVGQPLLWQVACETLGQAVCEWWPNNSHNSTADKSHWHRRRGQIFPHSELLDTHHTFGHLRRKASPRPTTQYNWK